MERDRKILIYKNVLQGLEDNLEAAAFSARVCAKCQDEKGLDQAKASVSELEKKIAAAKAEIEKELAEKE